MTIDDVIDELYGLAPGEFVARRDALSREARGAGDRDLAAEIKSLRRPTLVAWAVNQWVRRHPDDVDDLLGVGQDLAAAQRRSSATDLRALAARRSAVIDAAVGEIRRLAEQDGAALSENAVREVTQTLRAAVADEHVAQLLRRGSLQAAQEYSGFGPAGVFLVPDAPAMEAGPGSAQPVQAEPDEELVDARLAAAEQAVADRELAQARAVAAADDAAEVLGSCEAAGAELQNRIDGLRRELDRAETELRFAERKVDGAREARRRADAAVARARSATEQARATANELRSNR